LSRCLFSGVALAFAMPRGQPSGRMSPAVAMNRPQPKMRPGFRANGAGRIASFRPESSLSSLAFAAVVCIHPAIQSPGFRPVFSIAKMDHGFNETAKLIGAVLLTGPHRGATCPASNGGARSCRG